MSVLFRSFSRAVGQFDDPAFFRVLVYAIAGSALALAAMVVGFVFAVDAIATTGLAWLDAVINLLGGLAGFVLAYLMFPAVAGLIVGLFVDGIADAVERRHYPALGPTRDLGYVKPLILALKFLPVIVIANLVGLVVVYLVPGINLIAFLLINGFLLGREFFDMVALRRLPPEAVAARRRQHGPLILMAGMGIALLFSVPILNILAPVVGAATMAHIFQMLPSGD
ncbi:EI24 domain-containing protein [Fodinicurvata sp. EGI_FJ10296]|uniref:EI24 domain-containing protein n=1 Tax=Fodinicurvata sp. EGI_FJ10296 TaxID=3231908 RepID=UPI00345289BC